MGLLRRSLELGLGALMLTKEAADELLDEAAAEGEEGGDPARAHQLIEEIRERGRRAREELAESIRREVDAALERNHLVRRSEVEALVKRVEMLESRLGLSGPETEFESAPDL